MYTTRISYKCFILFLWFSLCVIRQVSSKKCYVCESSADEPCFNNVDHGNFQYDCAETIKDYSTNIDNSSEHLQAFIKIYSTDYQPGIGDNFDCVTITGVAGSNFNEERIIRGCIPKSKNCDEFEAPLIFSGFLTESCKLCEANLCNSHPQTKMTLPPKISKDTESYTESTTVVAKSYTKAMMVDTEHLSSLHENTESYAKAKTVDANRSSSFAEIMKFDYRVGFSCAIVLLASTVFLDIIHI